MKRKRRRIAPPKDSKVQRAVLQIIAMRHSGCSAQEISDTLGLTKNTIRQYLYNAHQKGWVTNDVFVDPNDRLEYVLADKAVRNLSEFLDDKDVDPKVADRRMTVSLEVAKGRGLLPGPPKDPVAAPTLGMALKIVVEAPPAVTGVAVPQIREGSIGGTPAFDAEVIESE